MKKIIFLAIIIILTSPLYGQEEALPVYKNSIKATFPPVGAEIHMRILAVGIICIIIKMTLKLMEAHYIQIDICPRKKVDAVVKGEKINRVSIF